MIHDSRTRLHVAGAVQGVGFRPFVYRLARECGLAGWVLNSPQGVLIEIEGPAEKLREFQNRLVPEKPAAATIHSVASAPLELQGTARFEIRNSQTNGVRSALILPDIATCDDCLRELFDPGNRRYLYPFINCTHCGPRFSIIEALPYDRAKTSMKTFTLCAKCAREYHDPDDRRFHAQPNACPHCGPHLELWDAAGHERHRHNAALEHAAAVVRAGKILALKGLGGFQLIVDARNEIAVRRLRERKHRAEKPFALMFPSMTLLQRVCRVTELESELLTSSRAPIVLLEKHSRDEPSAFGIAPSVAPGNPSLGVMLPYSPLHHLLMRALGFPVVATSGNVSDEPICFEEREALVRLDGIADLFLVHNRPIVRHMDDSVVRVMLGRELVLRAARGYAPLPIPTRAKDSARNPPPTLAVGAHLKNAVALAVGEHVFISQHIGDLETEPAFTAFRNSTADLPRLYEAEPETIACDLHPEYLSTKFAHECSRRPVLRTSTAEGGREEADVVEHLSPSASLPRRLPESVLSVQHHYAHVLSCMAENALDAPALGVCWDGTGYGTDGTIWGGEFLKVSEHHFERAAHLRPFRLPGGDVAVKQPRRSALGLLHETFGAALFERSDIALLRLFSPTEQRMLQRMLVAGIQSPTTSSAGRLFDGVAALIGLRARASFEGQAAMDLEFAIRAGTESVYHFQLNRDQPLIVDWRTMIQEILNDLEHEQAAGVIAAKFHNTLAEMIVAVAREIAEPQIVLTGGCFQNRYLTERTVQRLRAEGFTPHWHRRVPPNDGGIALGQAVAAMRAHASLPLFPSVKESDSFCFESTTHI